MNKIKQRLTEMGLSKEQQDKWLKSYIRAFSPTYKADTTPQQMIDDGKEDIILEVGLRYE